jgi:hypothetical protein
MKNEETQKWGRLQTEFRWHVQGSSRLRWAEGRGPPSVPLQQEVVDTQEIVVTPD